MAEALPDIASNVMFEINLDDYDYKLPIEKIAKYPLYDRAESKLLVADKRSGNISHHKFKELPVLIPGNSFLILNSTKVIAARLQMKKATGGSAEILCVEPLEPSNDPQISMAAKGSCSWKCMIGGKRIKTGDFLFNNFINNYTKNEISFKAEIIEKTDQNATVKFSWDNEDINFSQILETSGTVPLPPYIKRDVEESDKKRYQTVYARSDGSVAAPTAGLHFTPEIIEKLKSNGIGIEELTLHVGPGTFKPIDSNNIENHLMHSELVIVNLQMLENLAKALKNNKYIIAAGTTSLRTLESIYWTGVKLLQDENTIVNGFFCMQQWDAYNLNRDISSIDSISALINYLKKHNLNELRGKTQLFIIPGYEFKIINGLITNYHIPKSTLILLVAAFLGKELWLEVYNQALNNNYRFLSYGDATLLLS